MRGLGDERTFENLDRELVSTELEDKYPLSMVKAWDRNISDHTPLVLNTSSSTHQNRQSSFKHERGWLIKAGFYDIVADI